MKDAEARGDWNGLGLAAVHTVISAADALVARFMGKRSSSQDHADAADLIRELPLKEAARRADQAAEVLNVKHLVEYQDRDFDAKEATATGRKAERFLEWVKEALRSP